jgi:hypothetical protein
MIKKKLSLLTTLLLLSWAFIWFSINTKPDEIKDLFNANTISIINTLRISIPLLLSILGIPLVIFFFFKKKFFLNLKFVTNPIFLFLIYFILQSLGLYLNNKLNFNLNNSYLIILGIGSLEVIFFLKIFNLNKNLNFFLYFSIFTIAAVSSILFASLLKNANSNNLLYLYYYINLDQKLFGQIFPRITGLSRMIAVINLSILISFLYIKKNKNLKKIEFIAIISLSILIWSFQSRGAILCFYLSVLILFYLFKNYNFKEKIFAIFFVILFPIIIFEFYKFYKMNDFRKKIVSDFLENNELEKDKLEEFYRLNDNRIIRTQEQGSSGRTYLWKEIIVKYDKKNIFGYGPQADRFLISKKLNQEYGNNVSNGFLYAFACGGYFALIIFILINLKILIFMYKSIFVKKIFEIKNLFSEKLATIYLIFFGIRILFENSYAVFSVDFLITLICIFILKNYLDKKLSNI